MHLNTLLSSNVLNGKQIKVDAVSPKVKQISISEGSEGKKAFKAGETVTATATFTESILVQGSPTLILKVGSEDFFKLNLESSTSTTITFKGTVTTGLNGKISYNDKCITDFEYITDNYQNVLIIDDTQLRESNYVIDTIPPVKPTVKNSSGNELLAGNYQTKVDFVVASSDTDISKYEYSLDGGVSWNNCTNTNKGSVTQSYAQLCARVTDHAGNVSPVSTPIALEIESSFPDYNVECMTSDGYYSTGKKITFRVTFDKKINIKNQTANIQFAGKTATIVYRTQEPVSYAEFEYTVKSTDYFNLGNKTLTVDLSGIQDSFGFTGGTSTATIYRPDVVCDGVAPTATMIPGTANGDSVNYVINGNNVYSKGNKIKITFSEPVQKGRGNIILRQTAGWAIPPVLTAEEFNTICNQLNDDQKNILALRNPDGTLMEDVEDNKLYVAYRNNKYHGTGQYVGPYKKSMHGVADDGTPDISPKYVLDFDLDIWNSSSSKAFGKTYNEYDVDTIFNGKTSDQVNALLTDKNKIYSAYLSNEDLITPKTPTEKNISVADIRSVLEVAGYHKRTLDVTSPLVTVQDKIATVEFPAGLTGEGNLPLGREWELVIEEGAFLDMAGNSFGEDNQVSKAEVKIKTNNSEFFYSAGVASPVIRVDRYSYGLGIKQSDNSGNLTEHIKDDKVEPTGYVRVRIDCETKDAEIKYKVNGDKRNNESKSTERKIIGDTEQTTSYISSTSVTKPSEQEIKNVSGQNSSGVVFAVGSGSYKESYKGIIGAVASKDFNNSDVSAIGTEGVFQTVVQFVNPTTGDYSEASQGTDKTDWSIRGTTSQGNEPSISPFPLRDSLNGSPYLRITYRTDDVDYYWVSYEILVESSFSGHGWARAWRYFYNWAKNWGIMEPGEYTRVTNMKNWE